MKGYRDETYGERIADVYDDWFGGISDVQATVQFLDAVAARRPARILELAIGTGRLAIPLADLGHDVTGIDVSAAMLDRLRTKAGGGGITVVQGDMVDDLPAGPFDLVFVAYNSLFNLSTAGRQAACFRAVSSVLAEGGTFVVEAFVPDDNRVRRGSNVEVRSLTADMVVLAVDRYDAESQTSVTQLVELADGEPVKLRPLVIRWSRPGELDGWAVDAGLTLTERFADVERSPFVDDSPFHVSVYRAGVPTLRDSVHRSGGGVVVS